MSIYRWYVTNTTDIVVKQAQLQDRIDASLEITITLNSLTYSSNELILTFASSLPDDQANALNILYQIIVEEEPLDRFYPTPRKIVSSRIPNFICDSLNGYNIGNAVDVNSDTYVCIGNAVDDANWILQINTSNQTPSPTILALSEGTQPYVTNNDGIEKTATSFSYEGSFTDNISEFSVVGSVSGTAQGVASLVIPGAPDTVIATVAITSGTTDQPDNFITTTISNLPFFTTVLKIKVNRTSGGISDEVNLFSAKIKY